MIDAAAFAGANGDAVVGITPGRRYFEFTQSDLKEPEKHVGIPGVEPDPRFTEIKL